ncbi:PAS domain-containing protein [Sulfuriflexus mobilis]|uniref:PAS domain-containing protein n=1 Tax=Sulfuriflexus mobilis TaxID=1811807 RepID=UPI000F826418|nr:PAS domain-containing protein [Sulfuriflexus mobilis]
MKLSWRIFLLILVAISISSTANFLLAQYQQRALHTDSEKILARTVVRSLRDALVQDVIDGNRLRVGNLLKSLESHDNPIEFLYVTDNRHKVFAHSFQQGFPRYLLHGNDHHSDKAGIHLENKFQTQRGLIYEYSEQLIPGLDAALHIGINQSEIAATLRTNTLNSLQITIATTFLALLIAIIWGHKLTAPLAIFAEQVRRFGSGDTVNFTALNSPDPDIRHLALSFQTAAEERHQALTILEEREQDLAITLNSIGDAVIATDAEGYVTRMNFVAEQLTGWSLEEAQGQSLKTIFPIINATSRQSIENPVSKVIATGEIIYLSNHTTLVARDGTEHQIADSAAPIRGNDGYIQGVVLVFNDITEQYRLRELAAKNQRDLQAIMDNSPAVVYVKDTNGVFTFVNRRFEEMFHCERGDVIGKKPHDVLPKDLADKLQFNDKLVLETGHTLESEVSIPADTGRHTYIAIKFPLVDAGGNTYSVCGIFTNITDRKQQEVQLRHSQKMDALGKLTGGIAHDYNNMLGVILGYAELLEGMLGNQPKLQNYAHEIRHAGERGAELTLKLLAFSRKKPADTSSLDINTLIRDVQNLLEKTLTARIKLVLDLADDLWPVWLDSGELEDAIINISINAMHAIEGNGQLTIQTGNESIDSMNAQLLNIEPGDYVALNITDTGCGMDKATVERIFDPFFTTKKDKGTGLGLSQVYGFVERSGGTIKVYSEPGHGTRLSLYFPRHHHANEAERPAVVQLNLDVGGHETILLVDDEPALLNLMTEILRQQGYRTLSAESARQALEILKTEAVDLLLSDVIMPEMNGYELTAIVQKKYPKIKIQLASGFSDDRNIEMVNDDLHQNILRKPFQSQTLLNRIRELLDT